MNRRTYLALGGATVSSVLAGCNGNETSQGGNGNGGGSDEPSFTTPTISTPDSVAVDGEFSVTVSVTNEGGAAGSYADRLVATAGPIELDEPVEFTDVGAGETASTEFGPFTVARATSCAFELTEAGVTHELAVDPRTASIGETLSLADGLRATLTDVEFRSSLFYTEYVSALWSSQDAGRVFTAPDGFSLVVFELEFENVGTSTATVSPDAFAFSESEFYTSLSNDISLENAAIEGTPLGGDELGLGPSDTTVVWALGQLEAPNATGTATFDYHRNTETPADLQWEIPLEGDDGPSFPSFELESVDAPSETTSPYEITLTVRNTADEAGTFRGVLQYEYDDQWFELTSATQSRLTVDVPAGGRREITVTNESSSTGEYTYRLAPFDEEWVTTIS